MNLRIALVGAQGTGKTTLANELKTRLSLPLITEVARKHFVPNALPVDVKIFQQNILNSQIEAEKSLYPSFLSDRATIDNMAYFLHNCSNIASYQEIQEYTGKAIANTVEYTHIFYVPIEFDITAIPDDKFRNRDKIYQARIDATIKTILSIYNVSYTTITGTVEERISKILTEVKQ
jgi:adenylate kinase family enzyme